MKRLLIVPSLVFVWALAANTGMTQDDPEAKELRERLMATARELKEAEQTGRKEVAEELRRRAEDLKRAMAERQFKAAFGVGPAKPIPAEKRVQLMKEKLEQLRREGQAEKAEQLQAEIDRALHSMERMHAERDEAAARKKAEAAERKAHELRERAQREPGPPPRMELERRLHHLRVAVDNLHAAGLHDHAEKLMRLGEEMRHHVERQGPPPEFQELRHHVEGLTDRVRKLEETVERLQHDRR